MFIVLVDGVVFMLLWQGSGGEEVANITASYRVRMADWLVEVGVAPKLGPGGLLSLDEEKETETDRQKDREICR